MPAIEVEQPSSLPTNAYQQLSPGGNYEPLVRTEARLRELTSRAILWGVSLCVIFTVASAYSGLKVGQVMESAIPISSARPCTGDLRPVLASPQTSIMKALVGGFIEREGERWIKSGSL